MSERDTIVFLAGAVICVPFAKRLGLSSVIGYLLTGILIRSYFLGFVGQEGDNDALATIRGQQFIIEVQIWNSDTQSRANPFTVEIIKTAKRPTLYRYC